MHLPPSALDKQRSMFTAQLIAAATEHPPAKVLGTLADHGFVRKGEEYRGKKAQDFAGRSLRTVLS